MPKFSKGHNSRKIRCKYSSVFRENRCLPPPKHVYGGNFSHEAMTLKIRSRSPKANMLLILSDLHRLATLVNIPSNGPWDNMKANTFWLKCGGLSLAVILKIRSRSPKTIQLFIMSNVISIQIWLKSASWFMRYWAHKHPLAV